jgi:hypothetical protein
MFFSGVTYIDECVGPDSSAFYLGVFYTMAILGPALGYSIGGQFLNIHADFLRFFLHLFLPRFSLTYYWAIAARARPCTAHTPSF